MICLHRYALTPTLSQGERQEAFARSLDRSERNRLSIEMATLMSDQVAAISLVFQVNTEAIVQGLAGPSAWGPSSSFTWNNYLWQWQ